MIKRASLLGATATIKRTRSMPNKDRSTAARRALGAYMGSIKKA